jgi:quercetin dioxygenase-like cupin family protein
VTAIPRSLVALGAVALLAGCAPHAPARPAPGGDGAGVERSEGLVLQAGEGERRVRRPRPGAAGAPSSFLLKVDERNGGSRDLVMGYEEVAPGEAILPHRNREADEIVFVHRGSGVAELGGRTSPVGMGATLYVPRDTRIALRNTGREPLGVVFLLSRPGLEQLLRATSVPDGESAGALTAAEEAGIHARHRRHTVAGSADPRPEAPGARGVVLQASEGERRIRRPRPGSTTAHLTTPFTLKVDRRNGGSREMVMGYEELAPGAAIPPHRHLHGDEIIFVHRGGGTVGLGARRAAVATGATVFIPRDTRITLRNTGTDPLGIVFVFSRPGFEELMRANSVREGEPVLPHPPEEQARIRVLNRWHTVYEEP